MNFNTSTGNVCTFNNQTSELYIDVVHDSGDPKNGLKTFTLHCTNRSDTIPFTFWGKNSVLNSFDQANGKTSSNTKTFNKGIQKGARYDHDFPNNPELTSADLKYLKKLSHVVNMSTIYNNNPIDELLRISPNNLSELDAYTKQYGFLFNIPQYQRCGYTTINGECVSHFLNLFHNLYFLCAGLHNFDVYEITDALFNILNIPQTTLTSGEYENFKPDYWDYKSIPTTAIYEIKQYLSYKFQEKFKQQIYHTGIHDSVYNCLLNTNTELYVEAPFIDKFVSLPSKDIIETNEHDDKYVEYEDEGFHCAIKNNDDVINRTRNIPQKTNGFPLMTFNLTKLIFQHMNENIILGYINPAKNTLSPISRKLIDFMYIKLCSIINPSCSSYIDKISSKIAELANYVLEQEFNVFFSKIKLEYHFAPNRVNSYTNTIILPDLYTALLWGITYRFSKSPIERFCKRPGCSQTFLFNEHTDNLNHIYHDKNCVSQSKKIKLPQ